MAFGSISDLWNEWNIRCFIMLSLSLQIFLILLAPIRKKTTNHYVMLLLWLAYLMADSVATFTIGLVSHNQGNSCAHVATVDKALQAFWASFLLLHLGGPDAIIAFSLEDNSLWKRHLLSLIFQIGVVIYVFVQIFSSDKSLVIPTMLVFLNAAIKNMERILALNLSSLKKLRESVLSLVELDLTAIGRATFPDPSCFANPWAEADQKLVRELDDLSYGYSNEEEANLPENIVVKHAYSFFRIFKIILTDLGFTEEQRDMSRKYFTKVSAVDALNVISVELNFLYEMLHTKALVIYSKWSCICRFIAFSNLVTAFILFNCLTKHKFSKLDVKITYILLFGGIALEMIALLMLVFSNWTAVKIKQDSFLHKLVSATYKLRKPQFAMCEAKTDFNVTYAVLDTPFIFRRWSESISACNLMSIHFKESPKKMYERNRCRGTFTFSIICSFLSDTVEKIISYFHQAGMTIAESFGMGRSKYIIANTKYVSKNPFSRELWVFIFEEVKRKSEHAENLEDVQKIFNAKGNWFLQNMEINNKNLLSSTEIKFDHSIIRWHIATEMCYNMEKSFANKSEKREFSKILSDYMLYLVLNQSNVMSVVTGTAQITSMQLLGSFKRPYLDAPKDVEGLCKRVLWDQDSFILDPPIYEAIKLAKAIERLGERKWEVMSGVWVEMLSYAAVHIKGEEHVQVLSKGGELLTFVWLLMVHFGCFYSPEWGLAFAASIVPL